MDAMIHKVDDSIQRLLDELYQEDRCRIQVLPKGSISIGFGRRIPHGRPKLRDKYYGEWEIGSFHSAWRLVSGSRILYTGDTKHCETNIIEHELETHLSRRICRVYSLTAFDVRVVFESDICLDFLSVGDASDETFHLFCPKNQWVAFMPNQGWVQGIDPEIVK